MKALLLNDRLNIIESQIGFGGITNLIASAKLSGCTHIGLNQHDDSGFWEPKWIELMNFALDDCRHHGLKVIYSSDDISKGDRGNPAGWGVEFRRHVPQLVARKFASDDKHRVFVKFKARASHVYQLHYRTLPSKLVEPLFFRGDDWQISKYGCSAEQRIEAIAIDGDGEYTFVLRANEPFELRILSLRAVDAPAKCLGKITPEQDTLWATYHGTKGPSGHFHCKTPDLSDRSWRHSELQKTYQPLLKHYGPFIQDGTIDSIFIGGDEFTACGDQYRWDDYRYEYLRHASVALAMGLNTYLWARPGDYEHPSRGNLRDALALARYELASDTFQGILKPIVWAEETTEQLCADDRGKMGLSAIAGIYLGLSNPQHFKSARHTHFAAHWWPRDGKTWAAFPIDHLRQACEVFA